MTNQRQVGAAREDIKKSHEARRNVPRREPTRALPNGYHREVTGTKGSAEYYRVEIRPKHQLSSLRTDDVQRPGGTQHVVGMRHDGHWVDQEWLIRKDQAHVKNGHLVGTTAHARDLIKSLGSEPIQLAGDRFKAKPQKRPDIIE